MDIISMLTLSILGCISCFLRIIILQWKKVEIDTFIASWSTPVVCLVSVNGRGYSGIWKATGGILVVAKKRFYTSTSTRGTAPYVKPKHIPVICLL